MNRIESGRLLLVAAVVLSLACAELQGLDVGRVLAIGAPLDEATVARGLREALEVGTERTARTLSEPGGFGADPVLRLRLPGELDTLANTLRRVGFSSQVDELEEAMNRAAERAAAESVPVFASAIAEMTIADAFEILNGPDDAATVYFRERTESALAARFEPVVSDAMRRVGLYEAYRTLVARYEAIPLTKPPALDLEDYVTDRTLAGLFGELALEEARIRRDPAARSTVLLRRVFGAAGASGAGGDGGAAAP